MAARTRLTNQLRAVHPQADILFVGAKGRMEMTRVPEAGYPIIGRMRGLAELRGVMQAVSALRNLPL